MRRFYSSIIKELLLLLRDKAGIILLFFMPIALVFIMVVIQDAALNSLNDKKIPLLLLDNDKDSLSQSIIRGILNSNTFDIYETIEGKEPSIEEARQVVAKGDYQIGIYIPEGASDTLRNNAKTVVKKAFYRLGIIQECPSDTIYDSVDIDIFFDPSIRVSNKEAISAVISEYTVRTQSEMVYKMYSYVLSMLLPEGQEFESDYPDVVNINRSYATETLTEIRPNSVQHNIPSWTLFAMFFIVIPLGASIIKEKSEGTYLRLITMPGSYSTIFLGKITVYLFVCILQFVLLMLVGLYLIPLTGLPELVMGNDMLALSVLVLSSAIAAISFGVLVGTLATTHQQASSFGSVAILILAALGGLWMPTYLMPVGVRQISDYSPMAWAHQSFYDLFLRDANLLMILPKVIKLMIFAFVCYAFAFIYKKLKKVR